MKWKFLYLVIMILLIGCTAPHYTSRGIQQSEKKLSRLLIQSDPKINHHEARKLAHEAVTYSRQLATKYQVTTPPLVHNFLVNIGAKDRGLCYQWSDDLYLYLTQQHFQTIRLYPVGAYIGSYWQEHNAIVALPTANSNINKGILLDAWRNSGKLYFIPITQDPKYQWKIRTDRCDVYQKGK